MEGGGEDEEGCDGEEREEMHDIVDAGVGE